MKSRLSKLGAATAAVVLIAVVGSTAMAQSSTTPSGTTGMSPTTRMDDRRDFDWGWLGLLGLAGLAGLRRRDHHTDVNTRTTPR
ncbi:MAG: WGxxGxxG-CTERM domain-containing protein [Betaproteobacteria bacterium]|nr:WGxxGxxG-CTERM domain-containing protein [Betaproteobacteria bacterium]